MPTVTLYPSGTPTAITTDSAYDALNVSLVDGNSTSVDDHEEIDAGVFGLIAYTTLMISAITANIFAISIIRRTKSLRNNDHNLLIVNLNIIDLGMALLSMTFSVGSFFDDGAFLINNNALCRFHGFFAMASTVGIFNATLIIAIDRYITVIWSTRFPPNRRRILLLLAYCWIIAIGYASMPLLGLNSKFGYTPTTHHCSPISNFCPFYAIWFTHIYGVTVPIMIFCYLFVFRAIRQKENRLKQYGLRSSAGGDTEGRKSSEPRLQSSSGASCDSPPDTDAIIKTPVSALGSPNSFGVPMQYTATNATTAYQPDVSSSGVSSLQDHEDASATAARNTGCTSGGQGSTVTPEDGRNNGQFLHVSPQGPRKDSCVKWSLEDGMASGTDLDSDTQGLSIDAGVASTAERLALKKRTRKEKKRRMSIQNLSVDKQVALTGAMLVFTTFICWTPYNIIHACFFKIHVSHGIASLSMWIGYLNALLDPLIYTFMNRKARAAGGEVIRNFRDALARMCTRCADGLTALCRGSGVE